MAAKKQHSLGWAVWMLNHSGFHKAAAKLAKKAGLASPKKARQSRTDRQRVVAWAKWGVKNTAQIHYTESAARDDWLKGRKGVLPLTTDCSGFVTACYKWAGLPDPNGLDYKYLGYTGTLLDNATKHGKILTDVSKALPGDLIVYGPGTGLHVALIVEAGHDPLTVSHGDENGPELVRVSQDGRQPQRVCRTL